jgi:hypothetical protein
MASAANVEARQEPTKATANPADDQWDMLAVHRP